MNVLITSASRKVSLLQAFQRAARAHGQGRVLVADLNPNAPTLYMADGVCRLPRSSSPEFIPALLAACESEGIGLVVPTRDEELPIIAAARPQFEAAGVRVAVSPAAVVATCQDKQRFIAFCAAHDFAVPRTYSEFPLPASAFPVFVRPRTGKGGYAAQRIDSADQFALTCTEPTDWVVQELLDMQEYTIDLCADFDGQVLSAVPRSRQFVMAGESYVSRTTRHERLIAESVRLASTLGLIGHNTLQCFCEGDDIRFIEVNPRYGGAAALGIAAGADTPSMLLRLALGESLAPVIGEFTADLVMLRYTQDLFLPHDALLDL